MADVYGNIGDQPVELNNAATEATLKALLVVAKAQFDKQSGGKNSKAQKDLEKNLTNLAKQSQQVNKSIATTTVELDKKTSSVREARKAYQQQSVSIKQVSVGAKNLAKNLIGLIPQISQMGSSMSAATQVFRSIPVAGEALSAIFGAIAGAVESTQKAFMDASSVGANFGGSMEAVTRAANEAGLTIDQYTGIISRNGEAVSMLSSSSAEGAKRLSQISSTIRKSGLQDELAYLGYNTEQINEGMLNYTVLLQRAGVNVRNLAPSELAEMTGDYLKNLDAVSKLTGQSRKELEAQRQERQKDLRVRATEARLTGKGARENYNALSDIAKKAGPEAEKAFRDIFFGMDPGPEARATMTFAGESANAIATIGAQARATGELTQDQADIILKAMVGSAKTLQQNKGLVDVLTVQQDQIGGSIVSQLNYAQFEGKSFAQLTKLQQDEIKKRKTAAKEADPAAILRTQQKLAIASNTTTEFLVKQSDILVGALDLMSAAITHTIGYLNKMIDVGRSGGFAAVISQVASDIWNVFKKFMSWMWDSLKGIGEKLGRAMWGALPKRVREWFGDDGRSDKEKERAKLLQQRAILEGQRDQQDPNTYESQATIDNRNAEMLALNAQIAKLNKEIEDEASGGTLPPAPELPTTPTPAQAAQTAAVENLTEEQQRQAENDKRLRDLEKKRADALKLYNESLERQTGATTQNTAATNALSKETKAASSCDLDYSSPQALFNSFAKIMIGGKPGATDRVSGASTAADAGGEYADVVPSLGAAISGELGSLSAKYESAREGSMAVGRDQSGGTSYGKYQIASKVGSMNDFLKLLQKNDPEAYARLMASGDQDAGVDGAFAKEWKKLAGEGRIQTSEREFAVDKIFKPAMKGLKDQDLVKMIEGNKGLQEMMFSMAIQHGPGGAPAIMNKVFKKGMSPEELTRAAYTERGADGGKRYFSKSSDRERESVVNRFGREQADVLAMLGQPGTQLGTPTARSGSVTPTAATATSTVSPVVGTGGGTTPNQPGPGAPGAATSATTGANNQMETLNTNMGQLVALSTEAVRLMDQQLSAIKKLDPNLY
jgi:hypothetical protein